MAISTDDVHHIAHLARLGIDDERAGRMTRELNGILAHMNALADVNTDGIAPSAGVGAEQMPLRADVGPAIPMARSREEIAPSMRDGFFLVPRLSSHETAGE